jgi:branched-chain amino acid:cation transporter, LIVCS family
VQQSKITLSDTIGLGFMAFALFLGASNFIFPPLIGMLSGEHLPLAMSGFLITAVGLPLIALFAVAKTSGQLTRLLPPSVGLALMLAIYIIIGPAVAAPRTGLVAFEITFQSFLPWFTEHLAWSTEGIQLLYTVLFFGLALLLSLFPGSLVDSIGKVLTPLLLVLLILLAVSVFLYDGSVVGDAVGVYRVHPFFQGFLEGYNTMDVLGAFMFGMLIIDVLRQKGVVAHGEQYRYLVIAGLIASAGLILVYIALFYLGGIAQNMMSLADNGSTILTNYVRLVFGDAGLYILVVAVTLACLTTAVGLISACAAFFNEQLTVVSRQQWVVITTLCCFCVANIGLDQLIFISQPILYTIYPVAIVLVFLTLLKDRFDHPEEAYSVALSLAFFYGLLDGLSVLGIEVNFVEQLNEVSMGWLIPSFIVIMLLMRHNGGRCVSSE